MAAKMLPVTLAGPNRAPLDLMASGGGSGPCQGKPAGHPLGIKTRSPDLELLAPSAHLGNCEKWAHFDFTP